MLRDALGGMGDSIPVEIGRSRNVEWMVGLRVVLGGNGWVQSLLGLGGGGM